MTRLERFALLKLANDWTAWANEMRARSEELLSIDKPLSDHLVYESVGVDHCARDLRELLEHGAPGDPVAASSTCVALPPDSRHALPEPS